MKSNFPISINFSRSGYRARSESWRISLTKSFFLRNQMSGSWAEDYMYYPNIWKGIRPLI